MKRFVSSMVLSSYLLMMTCVASASASDLSQAKPSHAVQMSRRPSPRSTCSLKRVLLGALSLFGVFASSAAASLDSRLVANTLVRSPFFPIQPEENLASFQDLSYSPAWNSGNEITEEMKTAIDPYFSDETVDLESEQDDDVAIQEPHFESKNVFAPDQRQQADQSKYPEQTVGRLVSRNSYGDYRSCTATLVSREHVLTNGHCVFEETRNSQGQVISRTIPLDFWTSATFLPAYSNDKSFDTAAVKALMYSELFKNHSKLAKENDWAILQLDKALGDYTGWMGIISLSNENYRDPQYASLLKSVNLVGYSADKYLDSAGAHYNCNIRGTALLLSDGSTAVLHDCDATAGSSGSGLYIMKDEVAYIVALNWGEFELGKDQNGTLIEHTNEPWQASNSNLALQTKVFKETLDEMQQSNRDPAPPYQRPASKSSTKNSILIPTLIGVGSAVVVTGLGIVIYKCVKKHRQAEPSYANAV